MGSVSCRRRHLKQLTWCNAPSCSSLVPRTRVELHKSMFQRSASSDAKACHAAPSSSCMVHSRGPLMWLARQRVYDRFLLQFQNGVSYDPKLAVHRVSEHNLSCVGVIVPHWSRYIVYAIRVVLQPTSYGSQSTITAHQATTWEDSCAFELPTECPIIVFCGVW